MNLSVTLSFGGVDFCLTPVEDGAQASPVVSVRKDAVSADGCADSTPCIVAELSGFSGTLRICLPPAPDDYGKGVGNGTDREISAETFSGEMGADVATTPANLAPSDDNLACRRSINGRKSTDRGDISPGAFAPEDGRAEAKASLDGPKGGQTQNMDYPTESLHLLKEATGDLAKLQVQCAEEDQYDLREGAGVHETTDEFQNEENHGVTKEMQHLEPDRQSLPEISCFPEQEGDRTGAQEQKNIDPSSSRPVPPTPLHEACSRPDVTIQELRSLLAANPDAASIPDVSGGLPLHVISENEALLEDKTGRLDAEEFVKNLFDVHPRAIITEDRQGCLPFTRIIHKWIEKTYQAAARGPSPHLGMQTVFRFGLDMLIRDGRPPTESSAPAVDSGSASLDDLTTYRRVMPVVEVSIAAEWAFGMLSAGLDHMGGPLERENLSRSEQLSARAILANKVGSIPFLLKSILLIFDNDARNRLLDLSICRRILLTKASVGPWLVTMLKKKGLPSQRAVDYFVLVSRVRVSDFIGRGRTPHPTDITDFHRERDQVTTYLESNDGIIPALVILPKKEIERASTTTVVWKILNQNISRPFVIGIVLIDFVLHISLMLAYRRNVADVGLFITDPDAAPTISKQQSLRALVYTICIHFLIRKMSEAISMIALSRRVFRTYFFQLWSIIDIAAPLLVLATDVSSSDDTYAYLYAVTMGLLWLKLLGFLKALNVHLATFILAISQIMQDIRWFLVILLIVIFMFADMIHIINTTSNDGAFCTDVEAPSAADDFCSRNLMQSYVRVYSVLTGDYELDDYRNSSAITTLFIIFTFLGVIVLLNVLIAIVSDSYEKSRIASKNLFGRARVEFAAEHASLESFLTASSRGFRRNLCPRHIAGILWLLGWLVILSLFGTAFLVDFFLVGVALGFFLENTEVTEKVVLIIVAVALSIIMNAALLIVLHQLVRGCCNHTQDIEADVRDPGLARSGCFHFLGRWLRKSANFIIRSICERVFGITQTSNSEESGEDDEWGGRLDYITQKTSIIVAEAEQSMKASVKASEDRIKDHESSILSEIKMQIQRFFDILAELKG